MIMGEPRVLSVDSNCIRTGDETGGNGVVLSEAMAMAPTRAGVLCCWAEAALLGLEANMTVSLAESSRSSVCEFLLLRLSLLEELMDRLRKPELPPEDPRNGDTRPPMMFCINLFGVDGLG